MFCLGVEFSLSEILRVRRVVSIAGKGIQIPLTIALGVVVGLVAGWSIQASFLLGGAFAISSSIVTLTWLMSRGEAICPKLMWRLGSVWCRTSHWYP